MEAEILVGHPISTPADMELAADELLKMGAKAVLMKGGHLFDDQEKERSRKSGAEAVIAPQHEQALHLLTLSVMLVLRSCAQFLIL